MQGRSMWTILAVALMAVVAAAQTSQEYLDVFVAQVKPEKRAQFDAIVKRMVEINRQNKGDSWITMESTYGVGDRVTFVSRRDGYAGAEQGTEAFFGALTKALGKSGTAKLMGDLEQCLQSSHSELRLRRNDLSTNVPTDAAALSKLIGESRYLRTIAVHVRPGQTLAFEELVKEVKEAGEKGSAPTTLVSQAVAGQQGTVFYVTVLEKSLAAFDNVPPLQKILGDEGYQKFLKTSAEVIANTETAINRFLPEESNAPEEVAAAAPDYWHPKTEMAAKATKAHAPVTNASQTGKAEPK